MKTDPTHDELQTRLLESIRKRKELDLVEDMESLEVQLDDILRALSPVNASKSASRAMTSSHIPSPVSMPADAYANTPTVYVNFAGSGVKLLKIFGWIFAGLSVFATCVLLIAVVAGNLDFVDPAFTSGVSGIFFGLALCALFLGLSTMARTALYKRTLMEHKFNFEKTPREGTWI